MKRSEINRYIREMRDALDKISFRLPPFCDIPAETWKTLGHEYDEIRDRML
ncbi:MAG: D-lyxose/D-mannose family sugar isomerase, partial [Clostridia bacterium]|nr:D-lyxose/D-mannose family sugar isomerase [Clostridia bacterium]